MSVNRMWKGVSSHPCGLWNPWKPCTPTLGPFPEPRPDSCRGFNQLGGPLDLDCFEGKCCVEIPPFSFGFFPFCLLGLIERMGPVVHCRGGTTANSRVEIVDWEKRKVPEAPAAAGLGWAQVLPRFTPPDGGEDATSCMSVIILLIVVLQGCIACAMWLCNYAFWRELRFCPLARPPPSTYIGGARSQGPAEAVYKMDSYEGRSLPEIAILDSSAKLQAPGPPIGSRVGL